MGNFIKKLFVVLLLALVQTAVCNADSFKGKIVNAETGEILVGATIRSEINPQPGWSIQSSSETDSTGCFILDTSSEGREELFDGLAIADYEKEWVKHPVDRKSVV